MLTPPQSRDFWVETESRVRSLVTDAQSVDLDGPSRLPNWRRLDVVAHLTGNARGLTNLVTWARTGVTTPMYASSAARNEEIAELATMPPDRLRAELATAAATLREAYDGLTPEQLDVPVSTLRGEQRPAFGIAWMRARECAVHLIDLDIGVGFADLGPELLDALRDDAIEWFQTLCTQPVPSVRLEPTDRRNGVTLGSGPQTATVRASSAELVAWLQGRTAPAATSREGWPQLPPWL